MGRPLGWALGHPLGWPLAWALGCPLGWASPRQRGPLVRWLRSWVPIPPAADAFHRRRRPVRRRIALNAEGAQSPTPQQELERGPQRRDRVDALLRSEADREN